MKTPKGNVFTGVKTGRTYDIGCALFGFGRRFHARAAIAMPVRPGMRILDLGCGTGSLCLQLWRRMDRRGALAGIDLSQEQLAFAKSKACAVAAPTAFLRGSMDELPFAEASFDAVVSTMAFHEAPREVRLRAIAETARVLKPGGFFALVDWSRPRFGLASLAFLPVLLLGLDGKGVLQNPYPRLCAERGLALENDVYLNSLTRCQVFRLQSSQA